MAFVRGIVGVASFIYVQQLVLHGWPAVDLFIIVCLFWLVESTRILIMMTTTPILCNRQASLEGASATNTHGKPGQNLLRVALLAAADELEHF